MATAPYDTAASILVTARAKCGDMIRSEGGDILTNDQPFTQVYFQNSYQWLQRELANLGYTRFSKTIVIPALPVTTNQDISSEQLLNWTGFFDGTAQQTFPVLPQDLIQPIYCWERITGNNFRFMPMQLQIDGITDTYKQELNRQWAWENDNLVLPGATMPTDLQMKYAAFLPDLVTVGTNLWYNQKVEIMRCRNSLAAHIAWQVCDIRGDANADKLLTEAMDEAAKIMNVQVQSTERVNVRRQGTSRRSHRGTW